MELHESNDAGLACADGVLVLVERWQALRHTTQSIGMIIEHHMITLWTSKETL